MTTRYQFADQETYATVLEQTDPLSCFEASGLQADVVLFKRACWLATEAVPMTVSSLNYRKREREIRERLLDAIEWRNRWYREQLPAASVGRLTQAPAWLGVQ